MAKFVITKPYTAKSRPIIFNGEMVRAILDGRKTQTRRVINPRSKNDFIYEPDNKYSYSIRDKNALWHSFQTMEELVAKFCPHGKPGDFLWVKESFRAVNEFGKDEWSTYSYPVYKDGKFGPIAALQEEYFYKKNKWQSPIFMPRWASRITLEIKDIKIKRLKSISLKDIQAEGVSNSGNMFEEFHKLWDLINAQRGYSWESNPWVWVIEFERSEKAKE